MVDYVVLTTVPPVEQVTASELQEVGIDGDPNFVNPAYYAYAEYPSFGLKSISSNVPVSPRATGYMSGG